MRGRRHRQYSRHAWILRRPYLYMSLFKALAAIEWNCSGVVQIASVERDTAHDWPPSLVEQ